ncbi:MAG: VOC family protein [Candidatus Acidiferrum sp.]
MTPDLDHIILGCRDLLEGIAYVENLSGYRAAFGGSHPGRGTRNALLRIGQESYLEILAADPEQNGLDWHRNIVRLSEPSLVGWAVRAANLESLAASFRTRAIPVIGPTAGSRTSPSGDVLRWATLSRVNDRDGMFPFYIKWDTAHPARSAPGQCLLLDFSGTDDSGEAGHARSLRAVIRGQKGPFVLGSSEEKLSLP